ncbi:MAG TPA: PVC-type heme-binding CxxCH protein, partial [Chthoniobacter sp.]|nr:PVC-type heme-binding CxxCH protein [Chthoniobacter sp.]
MNHRVLLLPAILAACAPLLSAAEYKPLEDPRRPIATTQSVPAAEAPAKMTLPQGFHAQVVTSEPDIVQPVAYTIDDRGRLWVIQNTNYPVCPGEPKDQIVIFEDFGADGKARKKTVFYDKLTFATGIAVGHGGVWVGAPPNLLFFPLKDGEDKPAGEPQVVLDGWGNEDTHETLNDFIWGPDGWLYGTQGIFTFSRVGKPGTPANERTYLDAGVWRYHPTKKKFEVYAEGASNQWGVDWDDLGQAFFEACVIPHMWQCIQGARYQRQAGQHPNKFTYEDIKTIADFEYEKRAYCGAMVYLGGQWPAEYRNTFFFNDIHMSKMRNE